MADYSPLAAIFAPFMPGFDGSVGSSLKAYKNVSTGVHLNASDYGDDADGGPSCEKQCEGPLGLMTSSTAPVPASVTTTNTITAFTSTPAVTTTNIITTTTTNTTTPPPPTTNPTLAPTNPNPSPKPYPCPHPNCTKSYARPQDLTRHSKKHSSNPKPLTCHVDLCPRSIPREGFERMDHLVKHLERKHGLGRERARFEARLANPT